MSERIHIVSLVKLGQWSFDADIVTQCNHALSAVFVENITLSHHRSLASLARLIIVIILSLASSLSIRSTSIAIPLPSIVIESVSPMSTTTDHNDVSSEYVGKHTGKRTMDQR